MKVKKLVDFYKKHECNRIFVNGSLLCIISVDNLNKILKLKHHNYIYDFTINDYQIYYTLIKYLNYEVIIGRSKVNYPIKKLDIIETDNNGIICEIAY